VADGRTGEVAFAARQLQSLAPKITNTNPPGALQLPTSWPAVVQLAQTYGTAWRPGPRLANWVTKQVELRTAELPKELSFELPEGLVARPYQITGAHMIARLGSALLFDEPGTGKTITTILGLLEAHTQGRAVLPAVVVAPASVV